MADVANVVEVKRKVWSRTRQMNTKHMGVIDCAKASASSGTRQEQLCLADGPSLSHRAASTFLRGVALGKNDPRCEHPHSLA